MSDKVQVITEQKFAQAIGKLRNDISTLRIQIIDLMDMSNPLKIDGIERDLEKAAREISELKETLSSDRMSLGTTISEATQKSVLALQASTRAENAAAGLLSRVEGVVNRVSKVADQIDTEHELILAAKARIDSLEEDGEFGEEEFHSFEKRLEKLENLNDRVTIVEHIFAEHLQDKFKLLEGRIDQIERAQGGGEDMVGPVWDKSIKIQLVGEQEVCEMEAFVSSMRAFLDQFNEWALNAQRRLRSMTVHNASFDQSPAPFNSEADSITALEIAQQISEVQEALNTIFEESDAEEEKQEGRSTSEEAERAQEPQG